MTRRFKAILLSIARLSVSDQRWILKRIPQHLQAKFEQLDGPQQLQQARRFRTLAISGPSEFIPPVPSLPEGCDWLAEQDPLYIAAILEQGKFTWMNDFLKKYDEDKQILMSLNHDIKQIKPMTKQMLFMMWKKNLSFEHYLEGCDG